jgi:hypothetical protein
MSLGWRRIKERYQFKMDRDTISYNVANNLLDFPGPNKIITVEHDQIVHYDFVLKQKTFIHYGEGGNLDVPGITCLKNG